MSISKRQNLPPGQPPGHQAGLWVVATPIGNLGDLSQRAIQTLKDVELIVCEDTRRTQQLLTSLGFATRLERFDAHSSDGQVERLVEKLKEGSSIALVSDAGTPAISDPGSKLVQAARLAGVTVLGIPGPSAVTYLLSIAGFNQTAFTFRGFFPRKLEAQEQELLRAATSDTSRVFVWFESPERISDALQLLSSHYPEAQVLVSKELTKIYERHFSGTAQEASERVLQEIATEGPRGEWCFAVDFSPIPLAALQVSDWEKAISCLLDAGISTSEASKRVSQTFGIPKNEVYETALIASGKLSAKKSSKNDKGG